MLVKHTHTSAKAYAHIMADSLLDSWRCEVQRCGADRIYLIVAKEFIVMVLCRDNKHPSTFRPRKNTPMGSKVYHCH